MKSIFELSPELSKKMDSILERYEEYHKKTYNQEFMSEETSSTNKDSIKNDEIYHIKAGK